MTEITKEARDLADIDKAAMELAERVLQGVADPDTTQDDNYDLLVGARAYRNEMCPAVAAEFARLMTERDEAYAAIYDAFDDVLGGTNECPFCLVRDKFEGDDFAHKPTCIVRKASQGFPYKDAIAPGVPK